ncbi:MAG: hypothetical protein ACPGWR_03680 [Ardenticatenaceae bacterium]
MIKRGGILSTGKQIRPPKNLSAARTAERPSQTVNMAKFISPSQSEQQPNHAPLSPEELAALDIKAKKQAIGHEEQVLRAELCCIREKRKVEEQAWRAIRKQRKQGQVALQEQAA